VYIYEGKYAQTNYIYTSIWEKMTLAIRGNQPSLKQHLDDISTVAGEEINL